MNAGRTDTAHSTAFAAAFTKDVVLEASVLPRPITGAADVRSFFEATRAMYDTIAFKHEVTVESRTYLEWEGTVDKPIAYLDIDDTGLVEAGYGPSHSVW